MGKNKLARFAENETFKCLIQPPFDEVFQRDYNLKGKWHHDFFGNTNPIVLELGCGKGEYTVGLAKKFPKKNFIGIDIKGARIWKGAKTIQEENITNAAFIRTRIEFILSFFAENEVSEIWITFPDPQLKKRRNKKRLTNALFLNQYKKFTRENAIIHLKTDNDVLYRYTHELAKSNQLHVLVATADLYNTKQVSDILSIHTFYESQYLAEGKNINYLAFELPKNTDILELDESIIESIGAGID